MSPRKKLFAIATMAVVAWIPVILAAMIIYQLVHAP